MANESRIISALELALRELSMISERYVRTLHLIEDTKHMLPERAESSVAGNENGERAT